MTRNVCRYRRTVLDGGAVDEVVRESSTWFPKANQIQLKLIQCTYAEALDTLQIHPALIRMNMNYGYMRAADTVNPVTTCPTRCYDIADYITKLRRLLFELEWRVITGGFDHWTNPAEDQPISVPMLRWGKGMLCLLIKEREMLGGTIPTPVYESSWSWEQHVLSTPLPAPTPFHSIGPVPADINVAHFIPTNGTLLREESAFASLPFPFWPTTYIILGGAKFLIPTLQDLFALGFPPFPTVQEVPNNSIELLASIPWEGTLIKEVSSHKTYLIQNCKKRYVSPTVFNDHHFNPASVLQAPDGSLSSIPDGPDLTP